MEAFLRTLLPRVLPPEVTVEVRVFQGKSDLLEKLEARLKAYAQWLPPDTRLFVLVDRDDEDCRHLKSLLEQAAARARLRTRSRSDGRGWRLVNRVVIEELESWYFGDWEAVVAAFPRVDEGVARRAGFRDPDAIVGGTWEAFERQLRPWGYYTAGLQKIDVARQVAAHIRPERSRSASFKVFYSAVLEALESGHD